MTAVVTTTTAQAEQIRPQRGPQESFLGTSADIALFGGAAFGGKTWALLMEATRNIGIPGYYAVVFRRTTPQIRNEGGLWDQSAAIYPGMGGQPRESILEWKFGTGSTIRFAHMEYDKHRFDWQGAQLPFIGFDELTHFSRTQFWYMCSRLRTMCGVKPYIRATCNPDPDSFVAELVKWYVSPETGYPIPERSGVVRYFARYGNDLVWGATPGEIQRELPDLDPRNDVKSFTFIASSIYDNKIGLLQNPGYLSNLKVLSLVDRERLLKGNWKIRPSAGSYFRREWFKVVDAAPVGGRRVRYWDRAASEPSAKYPDPDWTVGTLMSRAGGGPWCVEDVVRFRGTPHAVKNRIRNVATQDGPGVKVLLARDPGQAGKVEAQDLIRFLEGFDARVVIESKDKETRAKPMSAQAEQGNVLVVRRAWNAAWFDELENFPEGDHDDQVDSADGAFDGLSKVREPRATWL